MAKKMSCFLQRMFRLVKAIDNLMGENNNGKEANNKYFVN